MKAPTNFKKKVLVLYSPGTNCEEETMAAFRLAGAAPKLLFLENLLSGKIKITDCDIFNIPGGFSEGDYIKEGQIIAIFIEEFLPALIESQIPVLLICNGYQIGARARIFGPHMTLTRNKSDVFCSRPILHLVDKSNCIWTKGCEGEKLLFHAAHGGGQVFYEEGHKPNVALTYASKSPNGGIIAGTCSDNGLILGLMDHPERPYGNPDGQKIFRNGIAVA